MEYSKLQVANQNNNHVRLFVKHEEVKRVSDEEFDKFYQGIKKKLGAKNSVSILNSRDGGNIIVFLHCKSPENL